jgi:TonB family protein
MKLVAIVVIVILLAATAAFPQSDVRIGAGVAAANLVEKVDPVYPPIALVARIQGGVVLEVEIAPDGTVFNAKVVSGHTMLITAATDAVRQWKYQPYLLNGEPVPVKTTVTVNFSHGISDADYKKDQETSPAYLAQDNQCRLAIGAGHFSEAENLCSDEVKTAEQFSAARAKWSGLTHIAC